MTNNKSKLTKWKFIIRFLIFIGIFGGIVALVNQVLRNNGLASPYTHIIGSYYYLRLL